VLTFPARGLFREENAKMSVRAASRQLGICVSLKRILPGPGLQGISVDWWESEPKRIVLSLCSLLPDIG